MSQSRRLSMRQCLALSLLGIALTRADAAWADSEIDAQTPTFYLTTFGGYSVYKSQMVQSNDTSTTIGYGIGVYAGDERSVGMLLQREQSAFAFELNGAQLQLAWQDVHLRYRWGMFYLGAVLASSSAWIVKAPPDADADGLLDQGADAENLLDVTTQGMGGNFGLRTPLGKRANVYLDVTYVTTAAMQEKALKDASDTLVNDERPLAFGPRMDLDLGAGIRATKWLEARGGFKYRTYQLSIDSQAYAEQMNTTYLGLTAGWFF